MINKIGRMNAVRFFNKLLAEIKIVKSHNRWKVSFYRFANAFTYNDEIFGGWGESHCSTPEEKVNDDGSLNQILQLNEELFPTAEVEGDIALECIYRWLWVHFDPYDIEFIVAYYIPDHAVPVLTRCRDYLSSDLEFTDIDLNTSCDDIYFMWEDAEKKFHLSKWGWKRNCSWPKIGDEKWPYK